MQLPNVEAAVVEKEKVVGYLLNPQHPDGAGKAQFFEAMGFRADQWQVLAGALRSVGESWPITRRVDSAHGSKYIVEGTLETPSGRAARIPTVWIVDRNAEAPRLATAYPI
ncbi:MAG: DUF6883 domain-containing protein [Pirellulales bacterium]